MGRLFLISTAALYLEIVLIRWLGTEVKIFAFFQNLSLIVCFLGFGVGCLSAKKQGSLLPSLAAVTTLVAMVSLPLKPWHDFLKGMSSVLSYSPDAALWGWLGNKLNLTTYYLTLGCSLLVVGVFLFLLCFAMIPLGRWVGRCLEEAPNTVEAYSINLAGSLVGIWLLAILAILWLPPACWFALVFILAVVAQPFSWRFTLYAAALLAIVLVSLRAENGGAVYWSPYQKLAVTDLGNQQYRIDVNNEGFMGMGNARPEFLANHPELAITYQGNYESPFLFARNVNRVLVIGSGAGDDVAAALRAGAGQVDAVEIDPLISTIGKRMHPEQPYESPRVHLITNDARNYMRRCEDTYDVIIFGALDSHTEFSGYSNIRVDNYVYTEESFREARRLLRPDGILVLKFAVRQPWTWIPQRFYTMLSGMFPTPPLTYYTQPIGPTGASTVVFIGSDTAYTGALSVSPKAAAFLSTHLPEFPLTAENSPPATTDDWPYVYHFGHSIPRAYFTVSIVILILALSMVGPFFKPKEVSTWHFFLLGAGFLLMETQLVSRLALYFGTTWLVNCVALSGVLTVLLLANVYVDKRKPENLTPYYLILCLALLADYVIPWNKVPGSGTFVGILICFAYCVPIFVAGIIFTESFRRFAGQSSAFGANMLGAVAGGLAQNLSFIFGMKALLLIAAAVYGSAALLGRVKPLRALAS
jgi:spermidine synthase